MVLCTCLSALLSRRWGGGVGGGGMGRREQESCLPGVDFSVCLDFYLLLGCSDDFGAP